MTIPTTDLDIGTRYALQEDFNNGFVGRDRQVVIQTDDPKGYRPVIMDGTTTGGKNKVALVDDLSDYVPVDTYNSEKAGFETTTHASATYATKTEVTSSLAGKAITTHTHAQSDVIGLDATLEDKVDLETYTADKATFLTKTDASNSYLGKTAKAESAKVADSANSVSGANVTGTVANATNAVNATNATSATSASSVPWTGVTGKPGFATVATTGSYNDLIDKPNISSGEAYITEAWSSGHNWYRVWSNGCIEQGGFAGSSMANSTVIVTLYKEYPNTNYNILLTTNSKLFAYAKTIQTTRFYASADKDSSYVSVYWYTIGQRN